MNRRLRALFRSPLSWVGLLLLGTVAAWQFGVLNLPGPAMILGGPDTAATRPYGHFTARVSVIDGDTLDSSGQRLRIHGIDAPELTQSCERDRQPYACGAAAREALIRILGPGVVSCETLDRDQFGRLVVRCHGSDGRDIGAAMVAAGWAIAFRRFSTAYVSQETAARAQRLGIWGGSFEDPSDYRRRNR